MKQKFKRMSKALLYWTSVLVVGVTVGFSLQFAKAWTEPGSAAPASNVGAPITTGATAQVKDGQLGASGTVDASTYGQTYLRRWGLVNTTGNGHIYMEPKAGANLYLTDNWSKTGMLNVQFGKTVFEAGNVGIGATNPGVKLDVFTNTDVYGMRIGDSANSNIRIAGTASGATGYGLIQTFTGGSTAGGQLILQRNGGSVGIGTAALTAGAALDVNGDVVARGNDIRFNTSNSTTADIWLTNTTSGPASPGVYNIKAYDYWGAKLNFIGEGDNGNELMDVTFDGNVGIGTTTPAANLHIAVDDTDTDSFRISNKSAQGAYYLNIKPIMTNGIIRWAFDQRNNNVSYPNTMVFKNGMVGIGGVTDPTYQLEVKGGILTRTPSYSANAIAVAARDIASFGPEDLFINWDNKTGNVNIGGQGETKTLRVNGDVVASNGSIETTLQSAGVIFSDDSMQVTALASGIDTNLCMAPDQTIGGKSACRDNYYLRGPDVCCPFNSRVAANGVWQKITSVSIAASNGDGWSPVYDNQFSVPLGKKVTALRIYGDADDGGYCYAYWGSGHVESFVHQNTSSGVYNVNLAEYDGSPIYDNSKLYWNENTGQYACSSGTLDEQYEQYNCIVGYKNCPQNPAFFDNNGTVRICQSNGSKGGIPMKTVTGLNILNNTAIHLKGQNVDGPKSGNINCSLEVQYGSM